MKTFLIFLQRNRLFSFVNVLGLSISLAFVLLLADMVFRQLTVDRGLADRERICMLQIDDICGAHYNLGDRLQSRYPEIEDWCAVYYADTYMEVRDNTHKLSTYAVRKNFFNFFSYPLVAGNREQLLLGDRDCVLTRSAAIRLFGSPADAVGKTLTWYGMEENNLFTVTGVVEDFDNSIFPVTTDMFVPFENTRYINWSVSPDAVYMNNALATTLFAKFHPEVDPNAKNEDMKNMFSECFWIFANGVAQQCRWLPMVDFYFAEAGCEAGLNQYSRMMVMLFIVIGVVILLMAVLNYVSMSVAQATYRAKEMATRRLYGSSRGTIFWRILFESLLMIAVSFLFAFLLAVAVEPFASELLQAGIDLVADLSPLTVSVYLLSIVLIALISGLLPASIISGYKPMDVVKGAFRRKTKMVWLRTLFVVQCCMAVTMLFCSIYLSKKIYDITNAPLGYSYGDVLVYPTMTDLNGVHTFRDEAQKMPFVRRVAFSCGLPVDGGNNNTTVMLENGNPKNMSIQRFIADTNFVHIYGLNMVRCRETGRPETFFSRSLFEGLSLPLGNDVIPLEDRYMSGVSGWFEDFIIRSQLMEQHPLRVDLCNPDSIYPWEISVEIMPGSDLGRCRAMLDSIYDGQVDGLPFTSEWYGDKVDMAYEEIFRMNRVLLVFTVVALLITLLGLTAMSLYFIAQRKHDMAVRKVFGSTDRLEMLRLMRFAMSSLGIGTVLSLPLMWIGFRQIEKIVKFDTAFYWWVPVAAFAVVAAVSLLSVWLISRKAVRENPVEHLKTE
ncbi:MAG: ABC transporter permease [bacterium]|uniref:ABC transporter permease n=1 Tax=Candidatus Aphodosoma intestinipullorum TaxID=2840674 RepID=A0A940DJN3_9BACT|nr:ABC transporter permease [Candidatus Aphodosoma intestinipullorum]